jgi:hypothetical protein
LKSKRTFYRIVCLLFAFLILSCSDDEKRQAENARDLKKKEAVFRNISQAWNFNTGATNETSATLYKSWNEWRILLNEMAQKPKSTIGAFRTKAKTLSAKAKDLDRTIPGQFARPEIKSRVSVLQTKINALNLFINLGDIPDQKVIALIADINTEVSALQSQMAEIVRRSQIPKEAGEADMLRMLDTTRAVPTNPNPQPKPDTTDKRRQMRERAAVMGIMKK